MKLPKYLKGFKEVKGEINPLFRVNRNDFNEKFYIFLQKDKTLVVYDIEEKKEFIRTGFKK